MRNAIVVRVARLGGAAPLSLGERASTADQGAVGICIGSARQAPRGPCALGTARSRCRRAVEEMRGGRREQVSVTIAALGGMP